MSSNLSQFLKDMDSLEEKINKEIDNIIKDVVIEIHTALREPKGAGGTPVVSGWLRSNYFVSKDTPPTEVVGNKNNVGVAESASLSSLNEFKNNELQDTKKIFITNNTPYGPYVNGGTNYQAGQMFVKKSVDRGLSKLNTQREIK